MVGCGGGAMDESVMSWDHRQDSNWLPQSDIRKCSGDPDRKTWASTSVVMLVRSMVSDQQVKQSTHVSR